MSVIAEEAPSAGFEYQTADSWEEAIELLGLWGDEAKIIAGGQSLVPILNLRLAAPSALIDINPIGGPDPWLEGEELVIPALARHRQVAESELVRKYLPILTKAIYYVGNVRVRNRGTIGGTVGHADPTAEICCALSALGANIVVQGPQGVRSFAAADFFVTYLTTAADPSEVITQIRVPINARTAGWGFEEVTRRFSDFATVAVAASLGSKTATDPSVRVVIGGVADRPLAIRDELYEPIYRHGLSPATVKDVAANLADDISPESDVNASAEYRRTLARVLVQRALNHAISTQNGEGAR